MFARDPAKLAKIKAGRECNSLVHSSLRVFATSREDMALFCLRSNGKAVDLEGRSRVFDFWGQAVTPLSSNADLAVRGSIVCRSIAGSLPDGDRSVEALGAAEARSGRVALIAQRTLHDNSAPGAKRRATAGDMRRQNLGLQMDTGRGVMQVVAESALPGVLSEEAIGEKLMATSCRRTVSQIHACGLMRFVPQVTKGSETTTKSDNRGKNEKNAYTFTDFGGSVLSAHGIAGGIRSSA